MSGRQGTRYPSQVSVKQPSGSGVYGSKGGAPAPVRTKVPPGGGRRERDAYEYRDDRDREREREKAREREYREREEREREREREDRERARVRERERDEPRNIGRQYDPYDMAPEDRFNAPGQCGSRGGLNEFFGPYEPVVRGSLHIEGVNYAKYEAQKHRQSFISAFLDSVRDDLISEVGNGVRREDILLQLYPGAIKAVVLHYDRYQDEEPKVNDPTLVDAEWSVKCDYAIRTRDVQRQQNVAMAIYTALNEEEGFGCYKLKQIYGERFDRGADPTKIKIVRPPQPEGQGERPNEQRQLQQHPPLASPTRGALPLPPQRQQQQQQLQYQPQPQPQPQPQVGYNIMSTPPQQELMPPPQQGVRWDAGQMHHYKLSPATRGTPRATPEDPLATPAQSRVYSAPYTASPQPQQVPQQPQQVPQQQLQQPQQPQQSGQKGYPSELLGNDGWTEYNGRRGLAVFIPEEALLTTPGRHPSATALSSRRPSSQFDMAKTPPSLLG